MKIGKDQVIPSFPSLPEKHLSSVHSKIQCKHCEPGTLRALAMPTPWDGKRQPWSSILRMCSMTKYPLQRPRSLYKYTSAPGQIYFLAYLGLSQKQRSLPKKAGRWGHTQPSPKEGMCKSVMSTRGSHESTFVLITESYFLHNMM